MTRLRWAGLGVVAVLVAAALVLPQVLGGDASTEPGVVTDALRVKQAAAALAPCPSGLGPAMPDLTVRCLGGGPDVRLSSALSTGRPTVVNVWGSWCGPCVKEVPDLIRFAGAATGRVSVVGVNTTDVDDFALDYAVKAGMHYASVVDSDARLSEAFGTGVPKTLLLAADGRVVHIARGALSYAELTAMVKRYLGLSV